MFEGVNIDIEAFNQNKVEAFIFYFKDKETLKRIREYVTEVMENFQPEMSSLFYDGPGVSFDKESDNLIEKITTEHFVEYIT